MEQRISRRIGKMLEEAESVGREDAAQAIRDVEDAIRAATLLRENYKLPALEVAKLILDESWRRREESRAKGGE